MSEQITAAVAAIAVHYYSIDLVFAERLPVGHAQDVDFLPIWLGHVYFVVNAAGRIEVECEVLESHALLVAHTPFIEQEQMVVWMLHGVDPKVIAHF